MSEYSDVQYLQKCGRWPNGVVPDWAVTEAGRLHCLPTNSVIIGRALFREIERLRNAIREHRSGFPDEPLDGERKLWAVLDETTGAEKEPVRKEGG